MLIKILKRASSKFTPPIRVHAHEGSAAILIVNGETESVFTVPAPSGAEFSGSIAAEALFRKGFDSVVVTDTGLQLVSDKGLKRDLRLNSDPYTYSPKPFVSGASFDFGDKHVCDLFEFANRHRSTEDERPVLKMFCAIGSGPELTTTDSHRLATVRFGSGAKSTTTVNALILGTAYQVAVDTKGVLETEAVGNSTRSRVTWGEGMTGDGYSFECHDAGTYSYPNFNNVLPERRKPQFRYEGSMFAEAVKTLLPFQQTSMGMVADGGSLELEVSVYESVWDGEKTVAQLVDRQTMTLKSTGEFDPKKVAVRADGKYLLEATKGMGKMSVEMGDALSPIVFENEGKSKYAIVMPMRR